VSVMAASASVADLHKLSGSFDVSVVPSYNFLLNKWKHHNCALKAYTPRYAYTKTVRHLARRLAKYSLVTVWH